ncbi:thiamine phosphate synthase [Actinoplanes sp. TBRC 11911]|uniref:thiamine phosphate synthase n=1 Tax=Actinoplanes sp. TBRC 11911 TaxID=2729386 RepID=UPI00145CE7FD|nr:thiamine phosphate synthase [Actinoplanes sp. TBRC 11911]NMO56495.1 thiamine phosphate synthase [Actinoplanes sp. TBRC 11911]
MVRPGGLVVLTDRRSAAGPLVGVVEAAVRGGAGWVILRERDLPYASRRALADELRAVVPPGRLIVAGPDPLGGDAVHLAESDPLPSVPVTLVGRSRHAETVGNADASAVRNAGAGPHTSYVTLSPIYLTESKPGYGPALGPDGAAALAGDSHWLALAGIDSEARAAECARAGAAGIAVMGGLMRALDPEWTASVLAEAFEAAVSVR